MLYRLERNGDVDLEFHGELLAEVSTWEEGKRYWGILRLYRSASASYVIEDIGVAADPNVAPKRRVLVRKHARDVRKALYRKDRLGEGKYLTDQAVEVLELAAEKDKEIADVIVDVL